MHTVVDVLILLNIVSAAILAGGQLLGALILVPSMNRTPTPISLHLQHHVADHNVDHHLREANFASLVTAVLILFLHEDLTTAAGVFQGIGLAGTIVVLAVSVGVIRPLNDTLRTWRAEGSSAEGYAPLRRRWDRFHYIRTTAGVVALACYVAAVLTL